MKYFYQNMEGVTKLFLALWIFVFLVACEGSQENVLVENSLEAYITSSNLPVQRDSLIACAGSGQTGILVDPSNLPVSIIFFPLEEISDVRYFETSSLPDNFDDFSQYTERELGLAPILDGTLMKFAREATTEEVIGFVTFIRNGKLFLSNRIHLKDSFRPTLYLDNEASINVSSPLMPQFSWDESPEDLDAIYFHVVSDESNSLLSGTYTFESNFQFYNLDNVVLNITDPNSSPSLIANNEYLFSVMGISVDNWVNFLATREFTAEE